MEIQFNEFNGPSEQEQEIHKIFIGSVPEQMPLLRAEGRVPASLAYAMNRRLYAPTEVINNWRNYIFFTADGAAYDGKGNVKIVLDDSELLALTPQSDIVSGGLARTLETWESLSGKGVLYFSKEKVEKVQSLGYIRERGSRKFVPKNDLVEEFWNFVSRGIVSVDEYLKMVGDFANGNESMDDGKTYIMQVLLDKDEYATPVGRSLLFNSINPFSHLNSNVNCFNEFTGAYCRLIGKK